MAVDQRILVVDDDRNWMETLADFFQGRGIGVATAETGADGLHLAESEPASLVLVDYHMPDMNGLEFLQHLREIRAEIEALLLSSDDEPSLSRRAVAAGARAFIPKSCPDLLIQTVQRVLADLIAKHHLPVPVSFYLPVPSDWLRSLRHFGNDRHA
ncbi:MAG: hypothetical protein KatS3mg105_1588 [Gemmatales bacterium]|nr:MAG: hypothetical protein KatS3mg105_1588 [Gemmatales bacterium]